MVMLMMLIGSRLCRRRAVAVDRSPRLPGAVEGAWSAPLQFSYFRSKRRKLLSFWWTCTFHVDGAALFLTQLTVFSWTLACQQGTVLGVWSGIPPTWKGPTVPRSCLCTFRKITYLTSHGCDSSPTRQKKARLVLIDPARHRGVNDAKKLCPNPPHWFFTTCFAKNSPFVTLSLFVTLGGPLGYRIVSEKKSVPGRPSECLKPYKRGPLL